ncbi:MAG TPA: hypothetical protein V6D14_28865 [Coleofasciculaceae cyanobacterium]|jgi:hypothetical protein
MAKGKRQKAEGRREKIGWSSVFDVVLITLAAAISQNRQTKDLEN